MAYIDIEALWGISDVKDRSKEHCRNDGGISNKKYIGLLYIQGRRVLMKTIAMAVDQGSSMVVEGMTEKSDCTVLMRVVYMVEGAKL